MNDACVIQSKILSYTAAARTFTTTGMGTATPWEASIDAPPCSSSCSPSSSSSAAASSAPPQRVRSRRRGASLQLVVVLAVAMLLSLLPPTARAWRLVARPARSTLASVARSTRRPLSRVRRRPRSACGVTIPTHPSYAPSHQTPRPSRPNLTGTEHEHGCGDAGRSIGYVDRSTGQSTNS